MSKLYEAIEIMTLNKNSAHATPPSLPELVHIDDSAKDMLNCFSNTTPATIDPHALISEALLEMKANNVHLLLVVDDQHNMLGILTSYAIHGEQPYKIMHERGIRHSDLTVQMLMLPNEKIACLKQSDLAHAKVGHILETLKANKRHYALVVNDSTENKHTVTGYFSAAQINKALGDNTNHSKSAAISILELQQLLHELES
jgi:CBS-domain-containing membrane protein